MLGSMIVFFLMFWVYGVAAPVRPGPTTAQLAFRQDPLRPVRPAQVAAGRWLVADSRQPCRLAHLIAVGIYVVALAGNIWISGGRAARREAERREDSRTLDLRPPAPEGRCPTSWPPLTRIRRFPSSATTHPPAGRRRLAHRPGQAEAVHPHRPVRVHHVRGLRRHLPVEVHPYRSGRIDEAIGTELPAATPTTM